MMNDYVDERMLVANACRVLAVRGLVDDILGHVSLRVDDDTVLIRARGPQERGLRFTTADDILAVPLEGSFELAVHLHQLAPDVTSLFVVLSAAAGPIRARRRRA